MYSSTQALRLAATLFLPKADSFGSFLTFREPQAGALCLVRYGSATPSLEIAERLRANQSVLIVPGSQLGLEGYLRIWLGGKPEFLAEGLRRIGIELATEAARG